MNPVAKRIVRFGLVGIAGFVVDAGLLYLLVDWIGPFWGRVFSFLSAAVTTWLLNRSFTFADRRSSLSLWRELTRYLFAMFAGGVVNFAAYSLVILNAGDKGFWPVLSVASGSVAGMGVNLALARFAIFRDAVERD